MSCSSQINHKNQMSNTATSSMCDGTPIPHLQDILDLFRQRAWHSVLLVVLASAIQLVLPIVRLLVIEFCGCTCLLGST